MATNVGRVGIVMKGDYNSASTYEALDAVSYNNGLYIAVQNVPAGTVPTNTTYWQEGCIVRPTEIISINQSFISSSSLSYTGVDIPIQANKYYNLMIRANYNNNQPLDILINTSETNIYAWETITESPREGIANVSLNYYSNFQTTLKIWAKYSGEGNNTISVSGYAL